MAKKIQLIIGSTRQNRVGAQVAEWVAAQAAATAGIELEVLDLKAEALPFMDAPIPPSYAPVNTDAARAWAAKIAAGDGYIFVTPEYNRGMPAALKNALDYLVEEWKHKPAAIVSYGYIDGGQSAARHLRDVMAWLKLVAVEPNVAITLSSDMLDNGVFKDIDRDFAAHQAALGQALQALADA